MGPLFSLAVSITLRVVLNIDYTSRRSGPQPLSSGFLSQDHLSHVSESAGFTQVLIVVRGAAGCLTFLSVCLSCLSVTPCATFSWCSMSCLVAHVYRMLTCAWSAGLTSPCSSQTDTRADTRKNYLFCFPDSRRMRHSSHEGESTGASQPRQLRYLWICGSPYSLSCGGQVPDVGMPHYRDARVQHRPVQCPSTLYAGWLCPPLQQKLREEACADPGPRQCPHSPHRGHPGRRGRMACQPCPRQLTWLQRASRQPQGQGGRERKEALVTEMRWQRMVRAMKCGGAPYPTNLQPPSHHRPAPERTRVRTTFFVFLIHEG